MQTIAVGTVKGGFVAQRGAGGEWKLEGPLFPGWEVGAFARAADGAYLAGLGSSWFGPAVQRSTDLEHWEQVAEGPSWPDGTERALNRIWFFHRDGDTLWLGVDDAGIFRSDDHGASWQPVVGLNEHSTRHTWNAGGGGLCAHHMMTAGDRLWVGISAAGLLASEDGGATWERRDGGIRSLAGPEDEPFEGACVHGVVADADNPDLIWRQDHSGVYRTEDGGRTWQVTEQGLPTCFGFPIARDTASGNLFVVPLAADVNRVPVDGRMRAYRSTDGGESWQVAGRGWSDHPCFAGVLRRALATDGEGGVCLGTTAGDLWASEDAGDTWQQLPMQLPRVLTISILG